MKYLAMSLVNWGNGAFIMIFVFALVIVGLVGAVFLLMNTDKKKENNK